MKSMVKITKQKEGEEIHVNEKNQNMWQVLPIVQSNTTNAHSIHIQAE
jgi:hypothetical protein